MKLYHLILAGLFGLLLGAILMKGFGQQFGSGTQTVTFPGNVVVGGTLNVAGGVVNVSSTSYSETIGNLTVTGTSSFTGTMTTGFVSSTSLSIGGGASVDRWMFASSTFDTDSIAIGSATTSLVTVAGAVSGDSVMIGLNGDWSSASSSVRVSGSVTAANTVTIYLQNVSSTSATNLSSTKLNVDVISH